MSDSSASDNEKFCPSCEQVTNQVVIQYEPEPNDAQIKAEDIPTSSLQLVAGYLCCECGDLISAHPAQVRRDVHSDSNQSNKKNKP